MIRHELEKTIRWYFILLFVLLLIVKCITVYFVDRFDYSNPIDEIYNEYIEVLKGDLTSEKEEYILTEWNTINDNISKSEEMEALYVSGEISRDEYAKFNDDYMYASSRISSINKVMEDYTYIKEIYEKTDSRIKPQFINSRYWDYFFDSASVGWFAILIIIIISVYSSSIEQSAGMWNIINAAYNGKAKILAIKMLVSALVGGVVSFVFAGVEYVTYAKFFDMSQLDAPIQSIQMFGSLTVDISIRTMVMLLVVWRTVAGVGIALISLLIAVLIRKDIFSLILMLAVMFVPVLLLEAVPEVFTYSFCGLYNGVNPVLATVNGNIFAGFSGWIVMLAIIVICLILNMYRFGYRVRK